MGQDDERKADQGRDARADSFFAKNLQSFVLVLGVFGLGGGGAGVFSKIADKQDATNEKLDRLVLSVVEIKAEVTAEKDSKLKLEAVVLKLITQVSALEAEKAAAGERTAADRARISALEGRIK